MSRVYNRFGQVVQLKPDPDRKARLQREAHEAVKAQMDSMPVGEHLDRATRTLEYVRSRIGYTPELTAALDAIAHIKTALTKEDKPRG